MLQADTSSSVIDHDVDQAFLDSIHFSPIATVISNPREKDNPIIAVNEPFCQLTGYSSDFVLGRNCRFLAGRNTEPCVTKKISQGVRDHRPVLVEIQNYKKDGSAFRNVVLVAPMFDREGVLVYFIGSQVEVKGKGRIGFEREQSAVRKLERLSPRQHEVLEKIAFGKRSKQIAFELGLTERTVKMHRALLMEKLSAKSLADVVRTAIEAGL